MESLRCWINMVPCLKSYQNALHRYVVHPLYSPLYEVSYRRTPYFVLLLPKYVVELMWTRQ